MLKTILKVVLVLVLLLVAAVAGFAAYVASRPNDYAVERSAVIAAPPDVLFAQVNDLAAWDAWTPWKQLDPQAAFKISNPSTGVGANFWWSGNDMIGEGTQTILASKPPEKIDFELAFTRPMQNAARVTFTFKPVGDKTEVTWRMYGNYDTFGHKAVCQLMNMDKMIGGKFEEGLANLKRVTETKAPGKPGG